MYFKIGVDGVKADSEEQALEIYNGYHGTNETVVEEVPSNLEVDLDSIDFPEELTVYEHTTVHDVFWHYRPDKIVEEVFL